MTTTSKQVQCEETPVFFPAGSESLFGIYSQVNGLRNRTGVLISSGGLTGTSTVGRNQMFVRLAHRLAGAGFPTLRFDYHGIGESTGILEEFRLDVADPFVDDIRGGAAWMLANHVERLVIFGKCFGSRMALAAAPSIENLDGVILVGVPVRDFGTGERAIARLATELTIADFARRALKPQSIRKLADPKHRNTYAKAATAKLKVLGQRVRGETKSPDDGPSWVSPFFAGPLTALLERGIPLQFVFGVEDEFYQDFLSASDRGVLSQLRDDFDSQITVSLTPGQVRGFAQVNVQDAIVEVACGWIERQNGPAVGGG